MKIYKNKTAYKVAKQNYFDKHTFWHFDIMSRTAQYAYLIQKYFMNENDFRYMMAIEGYDYEKVDYKKLGKLNEIIYPSSSIRRKYKECMKQIEIMHKIYVK